VIEAASIVVASVAALLGVLFGAGAPEPVWLPDVDYGHRAPLVVAGDGPELAEAIAWWNDAAGFELFAVDADATAPDVVVRYGEALPAHVLGATQHRRRSAAGRIQATVLVSGGLELPTLTLEHELGHAAGLAHDDASAVSVMRPAAGDLPGLARLSAADRAALRARYRP
jgi:hypothetical protein